MGELEEKWRAANTTDTAAKTSYPCSREQTNGEYLDLLLFDYEQKARTVRDLKNSLSQDYLSRSSYSLRTLSNLSVK